MSFKEDVAIKEQILRMDFKQAKILVSYYNRKPVLKDYEEGILQLAKERCDQLNKQNNLIIGE